MVLVDISAAALATSFTASRDVGDRVRKAFRGGIGVVLQHGECALIVAVDAAGQIAFGERTEHPVHVAHDCVEVVAHRVERARKIEDHALLVVERHALGEIARHRRFDDATHRRIELAHDAVGSLLLVRRFKPGLFRRLDLEGLDRVGDVADLVLAAETGQHDVEVAARELQHAGRERSHRPRDGEHGEGMAPTSSSTPSSSNPTLMARLRVASARNAAVRASLAWFAPSITSRMVASSGVDMSTHCGNAIG